MTCWWRSWSTQFKIDLLYRTNSRSQMEQLRTRSRANTNVSDRRRRRAVLLRKTMVNTPSPSFPVFCVVCFHFRRCAHAHTDTPQDDLWTLSSSHSSWWLARANTIDKFFYNLFGLLIPWLAEMSLKRTVWYKTMSRHTSPPPHHRFLHLKKKNHIFFVKV